MSHEDAQRFVVRVGRWVVPVGSAAAGLLAIAWVLLYVVPRFVSTPCDGVMTCGAALCVVGGMLLLLFVVLARSVAEALAVLDRASA